MSSWRTLLLRIGDRCPEYGATVDLKEHIDTCYGILWRELEHSGDDILRFFLECSEQLPHKIPLYGVLLGLLNLENEDFARQIVDITQTNLQDALDTGNCNRIRILMRFITALMCSKVLQPGSIVEVFETLLSSAATTVDEERGNPYWQPRADFYVTCILSCLPWGGAELSEQIPEEIERVLAGVEAYLSIRKHASMIGFLHFESNEESENGHPEKDSLEDLWDRIQALSNKGWIVDSVPKPHLSFEAQLVAGKSHDFGPINCPEQPDRPSFLSSITCGKQRHEAELNYPQRIRRLYLFPASKAEQSMQPIDRFIVEEYLLDVLLFFNGCRKECASYMAGLPVPFRYEYLMAETIFSQLLFLPHPPFKPVYYTLVIIDLCKALPGAFPAVIAAAVRSLFERIADLDMECRTRLILWFSHHLANFQFIWPWDEWAYVLELPKWAPQRVFVLEVLEREVRLSYWDKIKQSIENAPALEDLLPPRGGTNYRYSSQEESAEHLLSSELRSMVRGKKTTQEINAWMEENIVLVHGPRVALEVVIQTFLDIGSKSFTHLITVLERYGQVISKLCPDEERQIQLIDEVSLFWKSNAQMTAIAIDRMMGYRLISNLAIVKWVFFPSNVDQFHTSDCPWEILRNAINKTYNRILDLRKEISSLLKSISSAENSTAKSKAELEAAESKLEIVDGEPVQAENPVRLKRLKSYADKAKEEETSLRESLEAKEALLTRAFGENEALFVMLYKKFAVVLMERLARVCPDGKLPALKTSVNDNMTLDPEEHSTMDVDKENGTSERSSRLNGLNASEGYHVEEEEQWCRTTLGYVKAFSRQYASEIWLHIERLETEVFAEDLHPLLRKAVYGGLRRPIT